MGLGDTIKERNKASKQLIFSYDNNIVKRKFTNIFLIYLMPSCVWTKQWAFARKSWNRPIGSTLFPEVNTTTFDLYFHVVLVIMDMVIKEILKTHFIIISGTIMWKKKKRKLWCKPHLTSQFYEIKLGLKSTFKHGMRAIV